MEFENYMYQTVDKDFVETIVGKLKSQGIFDQFRKDCLADVDTKPAYQNLQERVNGTVNSFLEKHKWQENLNKTQLRESLRRHVQQNFLETGVDRIVDQVVNPKIYTVFKPKVEDVVYDSLGIPKPAKPAIDPTLLSFMLKHPPPPHPPPPIKNSVKNDNVVKLEDLLPQDLDPISPGSVDDLTISPKDDEPPGVNDINLNFINNNNNSVDSNNSNDSSVFESGGPTANDDNNDDDDRGDECNDSKLSMSDLTGYDSTKQSKFDNESNTSSIGKQNLNTSLSPFKNFSNLNEKIKQAEINLGEKEIQDDREEMENEGQNDLELSIEEQNDTEGNDPKDSASFKLHSEDSRSSISSIDRDKLMTAKNNERLLETVENEEKSSDIVEKDRLEDSSLSNMDKSEVKLDDDVGMRKHPKSNRSELSKHRRHHRRDDRTGSSRSDRKHRSKDDRRKHKDSKENDKYDRHDGEDKLKKLYEADDNVERKSNREVDESNCKTSFNSADPLGLMQPDYGANSNEFIDDSTGSRDLDEQKDVQFETGTEVREEKEDKHEKNQTSKHKEESSDKIKIKEIEDKYKERKNKESKDQKKSDKSSERVDKADRDDRSLKAEKSKHKLDTYENEYKDIKRKCSSSTDIIESSSLLKEGRLINEDENNDTDKEKTRKSSNRSLSRHSSTSSSSKNKSDEKRRRDSKKRKGERCEEIKVKESRRSTDRDHNGPGSSSTSTSKSVENVNNNSSSKSNETSKGQQNQQKESSVGEQVESVESIEQTNEVDILIKQINDSIVNGIAEDDKKVNEEQPLPKKPKIANNIFEIKKIMQARRNIERLESLERKEAVVSNEQPRVGPDEFVLQSIEFAREVQLENRNDTDLMQKECEIFTSKIVKHEEEDYMSKEDEDSLTDKNETDSCKNENEKVTVVIEKEECNFIKKHRIANNIYEVRKIMQMKKRLKKQQLENDRNKLKVENRSNEEEIAELEIGVDAEVIIESDVENEQEEYKLVQGEEIVSAIEKDDNTAADKSLQADDILSAIEVEEVDITVQKLVQEDEIVNAIEESSDHEISGSELQVCHEDNVENVEPKSIRTSRITRNMSDVRKVMLRKLMKRKLRTQKKSIVHNNNNSRKQAKTLLNSKKNINTKRKTEQLLKLKLIPKEKRIKLRKDNTRRLLDKRDNGIFNKNEGEDFETTPADTNVENCSNSVPLDLKHNENKIDYNLRNNKKEYSNNYQNFQDCFLGFTKDDLKLAEQQAKKIKKFLLSQRQSSLDSVVCYASVCNGDQIDNNSNMIEYMKKLRQDSKSLRNIKTLSNNNLLKSEVVVTLTDRVVQDILNGKNDCSIKLMKNATLDQQAKEDVRRTRSNQKFIKDPNSENIPNGTSKSFNNIQSNSIDSQRRKTTVLPDTMCSHRSEEEISITSQNKKVTENCLGVPNNIIVRKKINKFNDNNSVIKMDISAATSHNNNNEHYYQMETFNKTNEEKPKRITRNSVRSSQRFENMELNEPRTLEIPFKMRSVKTESAKTTLPNKQSNISASNSRRNAR